MKYANLITIVSAVLMVGGLSAPARAELYVGLGEAENYAVLSTGGTVFMGNDTTGITGNLGLSSSTSYALTKGTVTGTVYADSATPYGTQGITAGAWDYTTSTAQAVSDALRAYNYYRIGGTGGLTATSSITSLTGSTVINGNGGVNVFDLTSVSLNSATVQLNGGDNDYFIFRVTGDTFFFSASNITGTVATDHILWDVMGGDAGTAITLKNSGDFRGTVLAPYRAIQVDHLSIHGALIGGNDPNFTGYDKDSAGLAIHSAVQIYGDPFVPLPGAILLGLLGLGAAGLKLRKFV